MGGGRKKSMSKSQLSSNGPTSVLFETYGRQAVTKSWLFDRNFMLKARLSCSSGLALGVNISCVLASLFYVPTNLDFVFESAIMVLVTLLSKYVGEKHTKWSFIWASLAFLGMIPVAM